MNKYKIGDIISSTQSSNLRYGFVIVDILKDQYVVANYDSSLKRVVGAQFRSAFSTIENQTQVMGELLPQKKSAPISIYSPLIRKTNIVLGPFCKHSPADTGLSGMALFCRLCDKDIEFNSDENRYVAKR